MATAQMTRIVEHLRQTVRAHDGATLSDAQLLECFIAQREETAFELLVRRHGPMVLGVCRRVLGNHHDAEDAFQATFLVLVRKAASIVPRDLVGNWLYGVAYQTALKARTSAARRGAREKQVSVMPEAETTSNDPWSDLQPILDQELSRLGDKYRVPIVLCDLEGKTRKEAAAQLGVPEGTINSRLARGRTMLAKRLTRQGVTLSAGALATMLAQQSASAAVSATLVCATVKAGGMFAVGGLASTNAAILAEGVLKAMFITKLTKLAAALTICGIMVLSFMAIAVGGPGTAERKNPAAKAVEKQKDAEPKPKTDKEQLQGKWKVVAGQKYGAKLSPDDLKAIVTEIVFDGDKMSFSAGDAKLRPFKLDQAKKPKALDFYMGEGFVPAAYELAGNTLKICIPQANPEDPPGVNIFIGRPTEISGTGPIRYVVQFERVQEPKKKAVELERKQLEGTWRLVGIVADGLLLMNEKEVAETLQAKRQWLFDNEGRKRAKGEPPIQFFFTFDADGKWTQETQGDPVFTFFNCAGTSAIEPGKKPKTIDCTVTRSNNKHAVENEREQKGKLKRGIYETVDDTLRICWAEPGKDRPADFSTKADSGHVVWVLKRVQKAKEPVIREIDLKGFKAVPPKNDFTKPTVIGSAKELAKAFPDADVGFPDEEWREKIAKQVDFGKEQLLFFAWSGSSGERLLIRGQEWKQVIIRRQPGRVNDEVPHLHLFAISKEATWTIETGVAPPEKKPKQVSLILTKASAERTQKHVVFRCEAVIKNETGKDWKTTIVYPPFIEMRLEITDKQGKKLPAQQPYISVAPQQRDFVLKSGESTSAKLELYSILLPADVKTVTVRLTGPLPGGADNESFSSEPVEVAVPPAKK